MQLRIKILVFSLLIFVTFCTNIVIAQSVYFHYRDSVTVASGSENLVWSIWDVDLLQSVSDKDSISIWVVEQDTSLGGGFSGIPFCQSCSSAANMVLQSAYKMSYVDNKVIQGSCWDYVNSVFTRIESGSYKKYDIFLTKKAGPYAPKSMLRPGDWIYHVNYQFYGIDHSAIFICWRDYENSIAITLSYVGMQKWQTAKFGEYDLKSVYGIFRMQDEIW
jgi:hypothetical protein